MKPSYRWLARAYESCEKVVFGHSLQRCRTAFIPRLPERILSVGEGDGRFSQALLQARPDVRLELIEPDPAMRHESRRRTPEIDFVTPESASRCDAIILNFVLDLFSSQKAHHFLDHLPKTRILIVGDFFPHETGGTVRKFLAQSLVWTMYRFFKFSTGLRTQRLPPIREILTERGWSLRDEVILRHGFIRAQWWERSAPDSRVENFVVNTPPEV